MTTARKNLIDTVGEEGGKSGMARGMKVLLVVSCCVLWCRKT